MNKRFYKTLVPCIIIFVFLVTSIISPNLNVFILQNNAFAQTPPKVTLYAGGNSAFAVSEDGEVKGWGRNYYGNLGLGYFPDKTLPEQVQGLQGVKELAAGSSSSYALLENGTVMAWGDNSVGQLGIGNTENQAHPVQIPNLTGVKHIYSSCFSSHALALLEDGTVKAWGSNGSGQLGIGNTVNQPSPVVVPGLSNVKELAVGSSCSLALMNDGTVKAWGNNSNYELCLGDTSNRTSPTTVSISGVSKISAGVNHFLALLSNGTVMAWGNNSCGQLGRGNTSQYYTLVNVPGISGIVDIESGNQYSIALSSSGTVYVWGDNGIGQLGIGNTNYQQLSLITIPSITGCQKIATGYYSTFITLIDGSVKACGYNNIGQLCIGNKDNQLGPVDVPALSGCTQVVVGGNGFTLALKPDKTVVACGNNGSGQLGIDAPWIKSPTAIESFSGVKEIAVGGSHSVLLMNDGSVKSCGYNINGQLGLGDKADRNIPASINGLTCVKKVVAGAASSFVAMSDGSVKAWGKNDYNQLGLGDTQERLTPVGIPGLTNVKDIVGYKHTLVLLNDGTVKAWGINDNGQLGLGDATQRTTPITIPNLSNVKKLTTGYNHSVALLNDGTVKVWGENGSGQLGIGNTSQQNSPVAVPGLTGVKDIFASGHFTMALMQDGTVKAWGYNYSGQLGLGHTNSQSSPVTIPGLTGVIQIVLSGISAYAVLTDGTIKVWGDNSYSQLGLGDQQNRLTPATLPIEFRPPVPSLEGIFIHATENSMTISDSKNRKDKNLFRFTIGSNSSQWLDAAAFPDQVSYTVGSLTPNTVYNVKIEIKNTLNELVEKTYSVATKAQKPIFTTACEKTDELVITLGSSNPAYTDYQVQLENKYVNSAGELISSEQWIAVPGKILKVLGLEPNKAYKVRIRARNKDGIETEFSEVQSATTLIQVPQNIKSNPQSSSISITWDAVDGATGYDIEADGTIINVPDNLYFTHTNLLPETTHIYRVRAKNSRYTSAWSHEIVAEAKPALPAIPANLMLAATSSTVSVSWDAVPGGGVVYQLQADGVIVDTGFQNTYLHKNLTAYSRHTYRVRAVNSSGAGPWSPAKTITTAFQAPSGIQRLSAVESREKIVITWDKVQDAASYVLLIDGQEIDNGKNTFWIIYGKPDTAYSFKVKAVNSAGESAWSELQVRTYSLETPLVKDIRESQHEVALTWTAVADALEYRIERNGTLAGTSTTTTFTDTGLTAETKYTYRIKAIGQTNKESNFSYPMEAVTLPEKPAIPQRFYVGGSKNLIVISWDAVPGAIGYDLEIDGVLIENGSSTIYKYKDVFAKTTHTYRVRARNSGIEGDWHTGITFTALPDTITAPENIRVQSTATITSLTWQPVPDAVKYEVEIDGKVVYSGARIDYSHRRIQPNVEHTYRVRSLGLVDVSPWSDTIVNNSVKVVCDKGKNAQIGLTASNVTDFSGYTLTVVYNKDVLNVDDLCTLTSNKELTIGKIKGTDVEVTAFEPGKITFKVDKPIELGKSWSGIINRIGFKGKVTGGTTITYTVFIQPKEIE